MTNHQNSAILYSRKGLSVRRFPVVLVKEITATFGERAVISFYFKKKLFFSVLKQSDDCHN